MSTTYDLVFSLFLQRCQNHRQGNVSNRSKCALAPATCCSGGGPVTGRFWGNVTWEHVRQEMPPAPKYLTSSFCVTLSKLCPHDYSAYSNMFSTTARLELTKLPRKVWRSPLTCAWCGQRSLWPRSTEGNVPFLGQESTLAFFLKWDISTAELVMCVEDRYWLPQIQNMLAYQWTMNKMVLHYSLNYDFLLCLLCVPLCLSCTTACFLWCLVACTVALLPLTLSLCQCSEKLSAWS